MKAKDLLVAVLGLFLKIAILILAVTVLYRLAITSYDYGYRVFEEPPMSNIGRDVTVTITKDMGPKKMGELFLSKGLIRDDRLFILQYYASEFQKDIKSGEYVLSTAMTVEEMLEALTKEPEPILDEDDISEMEYAPIEEQTPGTEE